MTSDDRKYALDLLIDIQAFIPVSLSQDNINHIHETRLKMSLSQVEYQLHVLKQYQAKWKIRQAPVNQMLLKHVQDER